MKDEELTHMIIGRAMKVHTALGPGILESAYRKCLASEMLSTGLSVEMEKPIPLIYNDIKMEVGYRINFLVESRIVVEVKSISDFSDVHVAQILTYLRLANCRLGLLINLNVAHLRNGIKRIANNYKV